MILSNHDYAMLVSPVQQTADLTSPADWKTTADDLNRQGQIELLDELQHCIIANSLIASNWRGGFFAGSFIGNPRTDFRPTLDALVRLRKASAIRRCLETGRGGRAWSAWSSGSKRRRSYDAAKAALSAVFNPDLITEQHIASFKVHRSVTQHQMRDLKQASKKGDGWMLDLWKQECNPWIMDKVLKQELGLRGSALKPA